MGTGRRPKNEKTNKEETKGKSTSPSSTTTNSIWNPNKKTSAVDEFSDVINQTAQKEANLRSGMDYKFDEIPFLGDQKEYRSDVRQADYDTVAKNHYSDDAYVRKLYQKRQTDEAERNAQISAQAEKSRNARTSYEQREKNRIDNTSTFDWATLNDMERANANKQTEMVGSGKTDYVTSKIEALEREKAQAMSDPMTATQSTSDYYDRQINKLKNSTLVNNEKNVGNVVNAINTWGNDEYTLNSTEKKQFKSLVKSMGLEKVLNPSTENEIKEARARLEELKNLYGEEFVGNLQSTYAKTNGAIAFFSGLGNSLAKLPNTVLNATGVLSDEDYAQIQSGQNALRNNNALPYLSGEMAGTMTQYAGVNAAADKLGIGSKIATDTAKGLAQKTALNLGTGELADILLDTIPTLQSNKAMGKYANPDGSTDYGQMLKDTGVNLATNLAFNSLGEIGNVAQGVKGIQNAKYQATVDEMNDFINMAKEYEQNRALQNSLEEQNRVWQNDLVDQITKNDMDSIYKNPYTPNSDTYNDTYNTLRGLGVDEEEIPTLVDTLKSNGGDKLYSSDQADILNGLGVDLKESQIDRTMENQARGYQSIINNVDDYSYGGKTSDIPTLNRAESDLINGYGIDEYDKVYDSDIMSILNEEGMLKSDTPVKPMTDSERALSLKERFGGIGNELANEFLENERLSLLRQIDEAINNKDVDTYNELIKKLDEVDKDMEILERIDVSGSVRKATPTQVEPVRTNPTSPTPTNNPVQTSTPSKKKFNTEENKVQKDIGERFADLLDSANEETTGIAERTKLVSDINLDVRNGNTTGAKETLQEIIQGDFDDSIKEEAESLYDTIARGDGSRITLGKGQKLRMNVDGTVEFDDGVKGLGDTIDDVVDEIDNVDDVVNGIDTIDDVVDGINAIDEQIIRENGYNPLVQEAIDNLDLDMKVSKFRTNTVEKDAISDALQKGYLDPDLFKYAINHEPESLAKAAVNLQDIPRCEEKYLYNIGSGSYDGVDCDTMVGLYNKYCKEERIARANGDIQLATELQGKIIRITKNIQEKASSGGQFNQALAKHTRTFEGTMLHADILANKNAEKIAKKNPKLKEIAEEGVNKLRQKINLQFFGADSDELWKELEAGIDINTKRFTGESAEEQIKRISRNAIDDLIDSTSNKTVRKNFTDNADAMADRIASSLAKRQEEDINNLLNMYQELGYTGYLGIDDSVREEVENIFKQMEGLDIDSKSRVDLENQVFSLLADSLNLHGTFSEKLNNWRYFAMLANPKTHIRNIFGNASMFGITKIKDVLATAIEASVNGLSKNGIERTKAILTLSDSDRALMKSAFNDTENVYRRLVDGNKYYGAEASIESSKRIFETNVMNNIIGLNTKTLDAEDTAGLYLKYADSLSQYLKSNGADASIFDATDEASMQLLAKARNYAIDEAKKATFHQMSETAKKLSDFSKSLTSSNNIAKKTAGYLLEGVMPFKKTPINIVKTVGAYSPLEVVKVLGDISKVNRGLMSASEMIDDIAKGLTGTGLMVGGAWLAHSGILNGSNAKDGNQAYSIKTKNGSYTIDNFAPASVPLLVGANMYESMTDKDNSDSAFENFLNSLSTLAEPVIETTMLQGVADLLSSGTYGDNTSGFMKAVTSMGTGLATQFVPSEFGNIARTIDNTVRSSYTGEKGVVNLLKKSVEKTENKIPFLSMTNEPYLNEWGEKREQPGGNALGRFAYQHLSPGFYQKTDNSAKAKELRRLYDITGDEDVLNDGISQTTVNKQKLSPKQLTTYTEAVGKAKASLIDAAIQSDAYKEMTDEGKAEFIKDIYSLSNEIGKDAVFPDSSNKKNLEAYKEGGVDGALDYMLKKNAFSEAGISLSNKGANEAWDNGATVEELSQYKGGKKGSTQTTTTTIDGEEVDSWSTIAKANNVGTSGKAKTIYEETGDEEYALAYSGLSKISKTTDSIAYLENYDYSDDDKGWLLAQSMGSSASKKAQEFANADNYEDFYVYYYIKDAIDKDKNGRLKKSEKEGLIPYLKAQGYSQKDINEISTWYK